MTISTLDKLEKRIRSVPSDLTIADAEKYLKYFDFVFSRQRGSHKIYKGPNGKLLTLQGPIIKEYQIKQILNIVDDLE